MTRDTPPASPRPAGLWTEEERQRIYAKRKEKVEARNAENHEKYIIRCADKAIDKATPLTMLELVLALDGWTPQTVAEELGVSRHKVKSWLVDGCTDDEMRAMLELVANRDE